MYKVVTFYYYHYYYYYYHHEILDCTFSSSAAYVMLDIVVMYTCLFVLFFLPSRFHCLFLYNLI